MIVMVTKDNLVQAATIHSVSWQDSHKAFCSEEFIALHNVEHQIKYIQNEMNQGKIFYMFITSKPVGIVSVCDNLIENLYILPEEQHKGYGTKLLIFVIAKCDVPTLWILSNNEKAYNLYSKHGFILTGNENKLSDTVKEVEMKKIR
ncbi:GNAT family N-acetyltransferase [Sporanaerobacter sp. PP17-6a]|uniref:GNAT family N-acetyltransferase n=1 Tax=Sporanaerobacter sp. PP17-6a TaxID=1891289 RepID=UPI00089FF630|nr:GNAT family N-acetyltransferase [Sporanaerobacter sp. PP17-6a]MBE6081156.1 GNAT family N-acetyltransferase [Tissierellaceae bacterium]SCL86403.1 Acetyltransferase (GNAT) family protein [Sporanaerobacter sp. PP17-6a]